MSWQLKLKILENQGVSKEDAFTQLITNLDEQNRSMDTKLAQCIEVMSREDIERIFGPLDDSV